MSYKYACLEREAQIGDIVMRSPSYCNDRFKAGAEYKVTGLRHDQYVVIDDMAGNMIGDSGGWYADRFIFVRSANQKAGAKPIDPVKQAEKDAAELVATAEAAAADLVAKAEKAAAEQAEKDRAAAGKKAVAERLAHEKSLAAATGTLLSDIELLIAGAVVNNRESYAKFRTELQPLASTYGVKIVLVGDKTKGTLVVA